MKTAFKVLYDVQYTEKSSMLFGVLIEKNKKFSSFQDAKKFVDKIMKSTGNGMKIVGMPVIQEN